MTIRVGLIGCGRIARLVHLGVLTRLPGVNLVALAEPDEAARREAQRRAPAALAFTNYEDLLARPDVDAVVICLPNALHAEATIQALRQGKHVYLEKPLATSLADADRILDTWRGSGLVGMMGFNYRFNPLYQSVRALLRAGRLGEVVAARSVFTTIRRHQPSWKDTRASGGGVLLDLASHHIDLIHDFFDQAVVDVSCQMRSLVSEDDTASLTLRLANGVLVQSLVSLCAVEEDRFEVYGQAGKLSVNRYLSLAVEVTDPSLERGRLKWLLRQAKTLTGGTHSLKRLIWPSREPSYELALGEFVAAILTRRPAQPDFEAGYRCLRVVIAAEEAARH